MIGSSSSISLTFCGSTWLNDVCLVGLDSGLFAIVLFSSEFCLTLTANETDNFLCGLSFAGEHERSATISSSSSRTIEIAQTGHYFVLSFVKQESRK